MGTHCIRETVCMTVYLSNFARTATNTENSFAGQNLSLQICGGFPELGVRLWGNKDFGVPIIRVRL